MGTRRVSLRVLFLYAVFKFLLHVFSFCSSYFMSIIQLIFFSLCFLSFRIIYMAYNPPAVRFSGLMNQKVFMRNIRFV